MEHSPAGTVLVVCAANVCRSPFAQFLLGQALPDTAVASAGSVARPGDRSCAATAAALQRVPGGAAFSERHRSRRLAPADIVGADLVLVASNAERAAVASLDLASRAKTFTLIEGAESIARVVSDGVPSTIGELAVEMDRLRGRVLLPRPRGSVIPALRSSGIDVPDAHLGATRSHRVVHRTVERAVAKIAAALGSAG